MAKLKSTLLNKNACSHFRWFLQFCSQCRNGIARAKWIMMMSSVFISCFWPCGWKSRSVLWNRHRHMWSKQMSFYTLKEHCCPSLLSLAVSTVCFQSATCLYRHLLSALQPRPFAPHQLMETLQIFTIFSPRDLKNLLQILLTCISKTWLGSRN